MVRTAFLPRQHPDPVRIVAISASIALNAALFMFLMQPPAITPQIEKADPPPIHWLVPLKHVIIDNLPPQPPKPPKPATDQKNTTVKRVDVPPVKPPPVVNTDKPSPVDVPMPPQPTPVDHSNHSDDLAPPRTIDASLVPIARPAPNYPIEALRDGISGTVQLELLVGVDGHVLKARVVRGSGDRRLDNAAVDVVLRYWRFQPATENGVPVQALGDLPVVFTLSSQ